MDWLVAYRASDEYKRHVRKMRIIGWLTRWMRYIPIVGHLSETFWSVILDEGVRATLTPRWGALTFSFLGDGDRPSLWHTWQEITHNDKYAGVYEPHRAPVNKAEADALLDGTHPFRCTEHPRKNGLLTQLRRMGTKRTRAYQVPAQEDDERDTEIQHDPYTQHLANTEVG